MKKRTWLKEHPEPDGGAKQSLKTKLAGLALASTLIFSNAIKWTAQELKTQERKDDLKELVVKSQSQALNDTLIVGDETIKLPGIEPDTGWWEESQFETSAEQKSDTDGKWWIAVHWMLYGWTWVAWDFAEVCSDRWTLIAVVDMSHPQTWLGFTAIRLDDFHNDPDQPASRATVLNLHWNQKYWRFWLWVEWKYTFIDHLPQANWFSPDVVLSYTTDGWRTFEWMYAHKFMDWPDSDAFRLSVAKKVNKALTITWQWWYETWYDKHFYGRIIVDVNLWNWFWAQLSCISKYWKLVPTAWVIYQF